MNRFQLHTPKPYDKSFPIVDTKSDLRLDVDYDDVNRKEVRDLASEVVGILNYHFALKEG